MKSLFSRQSPLVASEEQFRLLGDSSQKLQELPRFSLTMKACGLTPLKPVGVEIFQVNMGKMCNQTCKHCHVDAGPDRKEIMSRETLSLCLEALKKSAAKTVDLTGGAPEMNPEFRWFVTEVSKLGKEVIVRCNLTIIRANPSYFDLPEFFAQHKVHVISSLPYYDKRSVDRQRGYGVFEDSIKALQMLNLVGYGDSKSGLKLDLVYNPLGAFLPAPQAGLEADFKRELKRLFEIEFNHLYAITNMPISRFLEFLVESENLEMYMQTLVNAFNPKAAQGVMCRNTISIGWDGKLYDCDFNQMLDLSLQGESPRHIRDYSEEKLISRTIAVDQHCYGCTAGSGSSCAGTTV